MSESKAIASEIVSGTPAPAQQTEQARQPSKPETSGKLESEVDITSRFAALNRREKEMVALQAKLKQENEQLRKEAEEYKQYKAKKASIKSNPDALEDFFKSELELGTDDILHNIIHKGEKKELTPDEKYLQLQQKFDEFIEQQKSQKEIEEQKNSERTIQNVKSAISQLIESNAEQYEYINLFGEQETVFSVMEQHFDQTGEVLSIEDACKRVEEYFEAKVEGAASSKKFKSKFSEALKSSEGEKPSEAKENLKQSTQSNPVPEQRVELPKTLTNSLQSKSASISDAKSDSVEEARRRAIEIAKTFGWR